MKILIFILTALFSYWISGLVHEMGHISVGLRYGWKFYLLVVGPIGLRRNDDSDKVSIYLEKNPTMWGGVGAAIPREARADNMKIWPKVLLGGPIASIIMGCIFTPLGIMTANFALLLLGLMPLGMGIACLLPLKTGITYTDGARWRRIRGGGQGTLEETALFKMMENSITKRDMRQIKYSDFEPLLHADLPAIKYYGYYYSYLFYQARNDEEHAGEALALMNAIKKDVPKIVVDDCEV
jgi:hypothetical protein